MNKTVLHVTKRIIRRSERSREHYLNQIEEAQTVGTYRKVLPCGNLAHGFAACQPREKSDMRAQIKPNIAIISAYNDLLSAHKPYEDYPQRLKEAVQSGGGIAQFAGGVAAMCDGITQGEPGMELSLMSRDVIAMSAAIALSHNLFDGGLMLGICDKIVPGLLIAALSFGHLPFIFVPSGPMPSGISNIEKAQIRERFSQGKVSKDTLLDAEAASYHTSGTCTFYGTANSNQLLIEIMGLQLPGSSFVNPNCELRHELTKAAGYRITQLTHLTDNYRPIGKIITAKTLVNAIIGLLASGGSTNHTMHLVAIARSGGFILNWDDFADLSEIVPLIARIYPNGHADINHFQQAGGMSYFIRTLLEAELLHDEVDTVVGFGLHKYIQKPALQDQTLMWKKGPDASENLDVLRPSNAPFHHQGGLRVLKGNLGRAVIKTSSLLQETSFIQAEAMIFTTQEEVEAAYKLGKLHKDCVVVLRFQGPKACGMPELHKLTPMLSVLQKKGHQVALVTDGRMSGASGKIPAAIHVTPEAHDGGAIAKVQTGDIIRLDWKYGTLEWQPSHGRPLVSESHGINKSGKNQFGMGRELFRCLRYQLSSAEEGACSLFIAEQKVEGGL